MTEAKIVRVPLNGDRTETVIAVPFEEIGGVAITPDGRKFVYVRTKTGFTPQDVKLERRSESQVVISGVREGVEVALANPGDMAKKSTRKGGALQALPQ